MRLKIINWHDQVKSVGSWQMHKPHLDLTIHQSKQQVQQHQVCPTPHYIKHFKNTALNIVLFISHDKKFSKLHQNSFHPAPDNTTLPTVQPLRKVVPRSQVRMFKTSGTCTHFMILSWVTRNLQSPSNYYNGFKRSKYAQTIYCWKQEETQF